MILIDGYNLLHVTGLSGPEISRREIKSGALERARNSLLNFLAASLDDDARQLTTVVFDATDVPPGLPRELQQRGINVRYATGYASADELLEELIREASAPKRLTVVSSDHRVQRAARRRKARAVDSDVWYAEVRESRHRIEQPSPTSPTQRTCRLSDEEVAAWLAEFGDVCIEDLAAPASDSGENAPGDKPPTPSRIENPFPPGYGEDLLDEQQP